MNVTKEATKDASRNTLFGLIAVIVTFIVNLLLDFVPAVIQMRPQWDEFKLAVIGLLLFGVTYGLTYWDSYIHHNPNDPSKGLVNF